MANIPISLTGVLCMHAGGRGGLYTSDKDEGGSPKESIFLAKAHQNTIQLMPSLRRNVCTLWAMKGGGMRAMVAWMHLASAATSPAELLHPPARPVLHRCVHHGCARPHSNTLLWPSLMWPSIGPIPEQRTPFSLVFWIQGLKWCRVTLSGTD